MSEHQEIWLEPKCAENNHPEGRQWCQDAVFETCSECGEKPTRYIRADIVEAERQCHAEVMEEVRKVLERLDRFWKDGLLHTPDHEIEAVKADARALLSRLEER